MIDPRPIPSARDLLVLDAPELAILSALEHVLAAACAAVEAANPDLLIGWSDPHIGACLPRLWSSTDIRAHAHALATAIARYRHALRLAAAGPESSDFPF